VIRAFSRRAADLIAAFMANVRQARTDVQANGNDVFVRYTASGQNRRRRRQRRFQFNYGALNTSGCPWPGRAAARARHHAGSGRRPK